MKFRTYFLAVASLLSFGTSAAEHYHFVPSYYAQVNHSPTLPWQDLGIVSQPTSYQIPLGQEACYAWQMGQLTEQTGGGSFGWATGFYPNTNNQVQSQSTDSGFQNQGDERGIYIATPGGPTDTVFDIQCGEYYGEQKVFYPWSYGPNSILKHGVTVKMPKAYHSNSANPKYYASMYLRVSERGVGWVSPATTYKGFWLQVAIVDGRGSAVYPSSGYMVYLDDYSPDAAISIEKSNRSGLIGQNETPMQVGEWANYKYFEYTIDRQQIVEIVKKVNAIVPSDKKLTLNPDDLMVYAIGTSPEVQVSSGELAVMGFSMKYQYVRTEY